MESERLRRLLAERAYTEFSDAADYIWKAPRLIEHEFKIETEKLKAYYPDFPEIRRLRWHFESKKLRHTFPNLIAVGNLFTVASLFEAYLMFLAKDIERDTGSSLAAYKGQGVSRILKFLKSNGIDYAETPLFAQVDAALRVRNCLIHANGILAWSRDENELRRLCASAAFLSPFHRQRRKDSDVEASDVKIVDGAFGDQLQISNQYAWLACWYFRDYFLNLCGAFGLSLPEHGNENAAPGNN